MNTKFSIREVFARLTEERLRPPLDEEAAVRFLAQETHKSTLPWYVNLFVGISAWVAAILVTAFFFIIGFINTDQALFFGVVFCALAIWVSRTARGNVFLGQLSLALSLTGQVLAMIGLDSLADELFFIVAAIIILELILMWFHCDSVLRFISILIVTTSILVLVVDKNALEWIHLYISVLMTGVLFIYLKENHLKMIGLEELILPVGSGLTISLLAILIMPLLGFDLMGWGITAVILFVFLLFILTQIVFDLGYGLQNRVVIALVVGCLFLLIPAISMPGILAALTVLLLGFWRGNRGIMSLASVFLIFYIGEYYYSLEWTLLIKSLALMGSGAILLALRYFVAQFVPKTGDEA